MCFTSNSAIGVAQDSDRRLGALVCWALILTAVLCTPPSADAQTKKFPFSPSTQRSMGFPVLIKASAGYAASHFDKAGFGTEPYSGVVFGLRVGTPFFPRESFVLIPGVSVEFATLSTGSGDLNLRTEQLSIQLSTTVAPLDWPSSSVQPML